MAPRRELADLTDEERATAFERFRLLQPALEGGVPLSRIARTEHLPLRTVRRWMAHYKAAGLSGLANKGRVDRGTHRVPAPLQTLIEGLALQKPPPSIAFIHRQVTAIAHQQGWPTPSSGVSTNIGETPAKQ